MPNHADTATRGSLSPTLLFEFSCGLGLVVQVSFDLDRGPAGVVDPVRDLDLELLHAPGAAGVVNHAGEGELHRGHVLRQGLDPGVGADEAQGPRGADTHHHHVVDQLQFYQVKGKLKSSRCQGKYFSKWKSLMKSSCH